jgi:hypothetical protein
MALLTSASKAPRIFKSAIKSLGYGFWTGRGLGGTKTQATSRSTGVTFDTTTNRGKLSGQITMNSASLAAAAEAKFTVTNKAVGAKDVVHICISGGYTAASTHGTPLLFVSAVNEGSFDIVMKNVHATNAIDEATVINFWVFKAVTN